MERYVGFDVNVDIGNNFEDSLGISDSALDIFGRSLNAIASDIRLTPDGDGGDVDVDAD